MRQEDTAVMDTVMAMVTDMAMVMATGREVIEKHKNETIQYLQY